jgi:2'-phosphotransferase
MSEVKATFTGSSETQVSKTLSWLLRFGAKEAGIKLDDGLYALVDDVLALPQFKGITFADIKYVVDHNDKKRFQMTEKEGKNYVRASQGHGESLGFKAKEKDIYTELKNALPICVHGTNPQAWKDIQKIGLNKMARTHIHFAIGEPGEGVISGMRKGSEVRIFIDMDKAMKDGIKFYISENKVILTEGIEGVLDIKYFKHVMWGKQKWMLNEGVWVKA